MSVRLDTGEQPVLGTSCELYSPSEQFQTAKWRTNEHIFTLVDLHEYCVVFYRHFVEFMSDSSEWIRQNSQSDSVIREAPPSRQIYIDI
jgi:hypothetical protein